MDSTYMEKNTVSGINLVLEPAKLFRAWRQLGPVNWSIMALTESLLYKHFLHPSNFVLNLQTWRTQLQPVIVVDSAEDLETEAGK